MSLLTILSTLSAGGTTAPPADGGDPDKKISITGATVSESQTALIWESAEDATYELQRATTPSFLDAEMIYSGPATHYRATGAPGAAYHYRVRVPGGEWATLALGTPCLWEMFDGPLAGWTVVSGVAALSAGQLLLNKGAAAEALVYRDIAASDYTLQAYIRSQSNGGLVFRYADENNYWLARWVQTTNIVELYEKTGGTFTLRASTALTSYSKRHNAAAFEPYELRVSVSGAAITATIQHYNVSVNYTSAQHQGATGVGFRTTSATTTPDVLGYMVAYASAPAAASFKPYGVLEYFQEPSAVRYVGKFDRTYEGWVDRWGGTCVRWFDHRAQVYGPIHTIDNTLSLSGVGVEAMDDHNPPALQFTSDGQLLVFYNVHNVSNHFYQKKTTVAEDLGSFGARKAITDAVGNVQYNYPQPITLSDGSIALFYRRGNFSNSAWVYKRSSDGGETWGGATTVADNQPNGQYAYVAQNPLDPDEVHLAGYFSHNEGDAPTRRNIWYARCADLLTSDTWTRSDGSIYASPVDEANAEYVWTSSEPNIVTDLVIYNGRPFIAYGSGDDPNHKLKYAELVDGVWVNREITPSRKFYDQIRVGTTSHQYTPAVVFNPSNPYEVVLCADRASSLAGANRLEIELWRSADGGVTWTVAEAITQNSLYDNFRPQWVRNWAEGHRCIWCGGGKYTGIDLGRWFGYDQIRIQSEKEKL